MSWDPIWEDVFGRRGWGRYPSEELIRFAAGRFYSAPDRSAVRILEIGCGPGANLWYFAREGFSAVGLDASPTALAQAAERLEAEGLRAELIQGDLTGLTDLFEPASFDAVVDVAALQHNRMDAVRNAIDGIFTTMRPGGHVFARVLAAGSWGEGAGVELEPGTYADIAEGPLAGLGTCHFFQLEEIETLFHKFADVHIEYSERSLEDRRRRYRQWVMTASRPE
jgi:SAM-dependent methyltransferase